MPANNPSAYHEMTPAVLASLTGRATVPSFTPAGQQQMQRDLRQQGAFENDPGLAGELLRRLAEVERTRRLADARGNAVSAEITRRGGGMTDWFKHEFLGEVKEPGYGGG